MIRVFLADDHEFVRVGMRHMLSDLDDVEVVGEAATGREVLNASLHETCDVLVLDLSLPRVSGGEVLRRVHARWPQLPIVVHSMYPSDQFAARALSAGARAYVSKDRPPADLIEAIRHVASTPAYLEVAPAQRTGQQSSSLDKRRPHEGLTSREHQVFTLIVEGQTVSDIAAELDIHSCTVSNHLAKIRRKLAVETVAEIVRYAYDEGLIDTRPL